MRKKTIDVTGDKYYADMGNGIIQDESLSQVMALVRAAGFTPKLSTRAQKKMRQDNS